MLVLKEICKDYGSNGKTFRALNNVSLCFPKKGFVAILGPSGCGKTTLLNILGGLDKPSSGKFLVDGKDTASYSSRDYDYYRNQYIGFIFQDYNLLGEMNALANVRMALDIRQTNKIEADRKALEALEEVGLSSKANSKPKELSGGQKQRVAIARALVTSPKILLADEPTGALDSKSGNEVMEILKNISKNILVVMVTHNQELARLYADRIIQMKDGVVKEDSKSQSPELPSTQKASVHDDKGFLLNAKKPKVGLGIKGAILVGVKHTLNKIGRSLTISISTTFGILALGFAFALMNGFGSYVDRINHQTGGQTPIVISALSQSSSSTTFDQYNQTERFPTTQEVYPFYSPAGSFTYRYNNFSDKFFDYLKYLKNEGYLSDYVLRRSSDNGLNVITTTPDPLNSTISPPETNALQVRVGTSSQMASGTGGNSYVANTIFHPLLDNYQEFYDLIEGKLPENKNELVMIVDYRNAVSFSTLKALGYYNVNDVQEDILDPNLESKVKPISFDTILNKEYKIFSLDSSYEKVSDILNDSANTIVNRESFPPSETIIDDDLHNRTFQRYVPKSASDLSQTVPDEGQNQGFTAKVVGIIRPKENVVRGNMSSGIGYLPDKNEGTPVGLGESIRSMNANSSFLQNYKEAFVRKTPYVYDATNSTVQWRRYEPQEPVSTLVMAERLFQQLTDADGNPRDNITASELQTFYDDYFTAYYTSSNNFDPTRNGGFIDNATQRPITDETMLYYYKAYTSLSTYFARAVQLGLDFSDPDLNGISLDQTESLRSYVSQMSEYYVTGNYEELYNSFLALGQLIYGNASVNSVVLMPNSISEARDVFAKLDEYNDYTKYDSSIPGGDPYHARDESEVVTFSSSIYDITLDIGQAIEMTNIILEVFAVITLIGSGVVCISVTNMSVLERTREIGILRALGASKKDIGFVFESDSFVVGFVGGLLGCIFTYIFTFPVNALINSFYPGYQIESIASMAWWHPFILIPLAVIITMVSALIPSLHAANKKPVLCLRNDQ